MHEKQSTRAAAGKKGGVVTSPPATKMVRKKLQLSPWTFVDNRSGMCKARFTEDEAANKATG
jgi:hypothetical protein